jgi:ribosomal protein S18 acetylase RimI-like enzyme
MIKRILDGKDCVICDKLLNKLIIDEAKYDDTIDKKFIVKDYFSNVIKNKDNILLGNFWDNKIVGYLFLKKEDKGYLIDGLYVEEDYRNQGIAKSLIEEAIKIVKEKEVSSLSINVMYENKIALKLYKYLGFKEFKIMLKKDL